VEVAWDLAGRFSTHNVNVWLSECYHDIHRVL
jgi:hypothetical protein